MVFDKLQSINRKTAAVCVAALLTGFIAGAGYAWSSNKTSPHYNTAKLKQAALCQGGNRQTAVRCAAG